MNDRNDIRSLLSIAEAMTLSELGVIRVKDLKQLLEGMGKTDW